MTLARRICVYNGPPPPAPADLIDRYAEEVLAARLAPKTVELYSLWLRDVLDGCGEAGLLTAPTAVAVAYYRSTGWPQDRYRAQRIAAVLDDFRAWAAGH